MKFSCNTVIMLPKARVIELFNNPDNLVHWQDGFIKFEHLEGTPGAVGSKALMSYKVNNKALDITENILVNNLPHEFTGLYEYAPMTNTMQNLFEELSANETKYVANIEYTQLNGIMVKIMTFLFPGMFKKQVKKWMDQFKDFAENADK